MEKVRMKYSTFIIMISILLLFSILSATIFGNSTFLQNFFTFLLSLLLANLPAKSLIEE